MNKNLLKHITGIIIVTYIIFIACSFHYYTNKVEDAMKNAYVEFAKNLRAKALIDDKGICYNVEISVNEDLANGNKSKVFNDQFENFLAAHYNAQTFWLNTWMTLIGIALAVVTVIMPIFFMKWHDNKMKEIDRDLEKFKDERKRIINDLKNTKDETEKFKLDAEKASLKSKLYKEFNKVDSLIASSMYREAFDVLEKISKNDLTDSEKALLLASKGTILFHLNDIQSAIKYYILATEKDPGNARLFNTLGNYYFSDNQFKLAEENFLKAIKLNPNIILFWRNLNALYLKQGKEEESYNCLKQILHISPQDSLALNNIGTYFLSLGRNDEAETYYQEAIKIDPQNAYLAYSNMGYIYNIKGQIDEAIIYISKGISIRPDVALQYANLAISYLMKKDFQNAVTYLNIFLNKKEIETVYYSRGNLIIAEIGKQIENIKIPDEYKYIKDLINRALKKFEDHAKKIK